MSGREIAEEAGKRLPGIKVLFMSGYPRGADTSQDQSIDGVSLLEKPLRKSEFAHAPSAAFADRVKPALSG